jgi:hypothetical protein
MNFGVMASAVGKEQFHAFKVPEARADASHFIWWIRVVQERGLYFDSNDALMRFAHHPLEVPTHGYLGRLVILNLLSIPAVLDFVEESLFQKL